MGTAESVRATGTRKPNPRSSSGLRYARCYRFVDDDTRSPFDTDYNNFSPRLGFAWAVNEKTSIRGARIALTAVARDCVRSHRVRFQRNSIRGRSASTRTDAYATLANPYPKGLLIPPGSSLGENTFLGLGAGTILTGNMNPEIIRGTFRFSASCPGSSSWRRTTQEAAAFTC